jgi:hypothetical protein
MLVLVAFVAGLSFAEDRAVERKSLAIDRESATLTASPNSGVQTPGLLKTAAVTWVLVDSCPNVYGQANPGSEAMWYDEDLDALVVIHRGMTTGQGGYSSSSGNLYYNLSTDGGATWPRYGDLNAGTANLLRYPSVTISNAQGSSNIADAILVWAAPNLDAPAGFGDMSYGVDFPLGGGAPVAFNVAIDSGLSSSVALHTNGANTLWSMDGDIGVYHWNTLDFVTVNGSYPAPWDYTNIPNAWGYVGPAKSVTGTMDYLGYQGRFTGNDTNTVINFGYSTSGDGGATWSGWTTPSPSLNSLPGMGPNYDIDRVPTGVASDMVVDANGYPHFFAVAVDTTTDTYSLIEVYESASGWAVTFIKTGLNNDTKKAYGGLDQTSWAVRAAIDAGGNVMGVAWQDGATSAATDTLADIWFTSRDIAGSWSTPENITMSPALPELVLHAAPLLKSNGSDSYTMYMSVSTSRDNLSNPGEVDVTMMWVGSHTFNVVTDVRELPGVPETYALEQNYPNPFNPSTVINYSIPTAGFVSLKVYDLLGQEIATLVSEDHQPGNYSVDFSATDLANGAYFYRITAGSFTDVKKMVLMK